MLTSAHTHRALACVTGRAHFTIPPLTGGARITSAAGPFHSVPSAVPVGSRGAGAGEAAGRSHFRPIGARNHFELAHHGANNA